MYENGRYIPDGAQKLEDRDADAVVYVRTLPNGHIHAIGYHGSKAKNHDFNYSFPTNRAAEQYINSFFEGRKQHHQIVEDWRKKRNQPHTLKVGDILDSSWGYDQTNVDFYQVVEVKGSRTVVICEIASHRVDGDGWYGHVVPIKNKFVGEPMTKRPDANNVITLTSYSIASPWDGTPQHYSDGH